MFKVRFHLGAGKNFGHWQIKRCSDSTTRYIDPAKVCLEMRDSKLVNHLGTAKKINCGASKSVCAWIICESIIIHQDENQLDRVQSSQQLSYNPKVHPNWVGHDGTNMDGHTIAHIVTYKKKLFYSNTTIP